MNINRLRLFNLCLIVAAIWGILPNSLRTPDGTFHLYSHPELSNAVTIHRGLDRNLSDDLSMTISRNAVVKLGLNPETGLGVTINF